MDTLLSNEDLRKLTEKYHFNDGSEAPLLIKLLWDIRHFREDVQSLPLNQKQYLLALSLEMDNAISLQILEFAQS